MKKIHYVILLFCVFTLSHSLTAQWQHITNGMSNRSINALAFKENYIFAGTRDSGVYVSVDYGANWFQTPLNNSTITSLAVSGNIIFAGSYILFASTDNGANWSPRPIGDHYIYSLAVKGSYLFAGTTDYIGNPYGVAVSSNNGLNWTQTSLNNKYVYALLVSGNKLFAGTNSGVYLSTNNGLNWTQTSLNNRTVLSLAGNSDHVYAGTFSPDTLHGLLFTANSGINWIQSTVNNTNIFSIAAINATIMAGTNNIGGLFYISYDNGIHWVVRNEELYTTAVTALGITDNYIFAGTFGNSMYRRKFDELTNIQPISADIPDRFSLSQNYPNPFNPSTAIKFGLTKSGFVKLKIYNSMGSEVASLVNENLNAGTYEYKWNAENLASGIYYYNIQTQGFNETKKMILIK